jgi:hypothetical protein
MDMSGHAPVALNSGKVPVGLQDERAPERSQLSEEKRTCAPHPAPNPHVIEDREREEDVCVCVCVCVEGSGGKVRGIIFVITEETGICRAISPLPHTS